MNQLVRLSIFFIAIYFLVALVFAWDGYVISKSEHYRFLLEYILYLAAKDNPKYNCEYARFLALSVFLTDTFTCLDQKFDLVPDPYLFLAVLSSLWAVTIVATIILVIRHFKKVRKLKRKKRYEDSIK